MCCMSTSHICSICLRFLLGMPPFVSSMCNKRNPYNTKQKQSTLSCFDFLHLVQAQHRSAQPESSLVWQNNRAWLGKRELHLVKYRKDGVHGKIFCCSNNTNPENDLSFYFYFFDLIKPPAKCCYQAIYFRKE